MIGFYSPLRRRTLRGFFDNLGSPKGQCHQLKKIKCKREIKQGRKRKLIEFPHESPGRRRGILKGAPCTEAPLKPASLVPFLPGQERNAPGRASPLVPLYREGLSTVLRPPLQHSVTASPCHLPLHRGGFARFASLPAACYRLTANQMLPGGRGKPLPYALGPILAA